MLYRELIKHDIITRLYPLLKKGHCYMNEEGKIVLVRSVEYDSNWIHFQKDNRRACQYLTDILFNYIFRRKLVPSTCQNCWKVVVTLNNVRELFAMYALQKQLGVNSKCGIEGDRPNTPRLYGAYFYNRSLKEGRDCYKRIKSILESRTEYELEVFGNKSKVWFDSDISNRIILKRGCTEMEQACGRSDCWTVTERQKEIERMVSEIVVQNEEVCEDYNSPDFQVAYTMRKWIASAYKWGDSTYTPVSYTHLTLPTTERV